MSELPKGWSLVQLSEACIINPPKHLQNHISLDIKVTFVPMAAVDANLGSIKFATNCFYSEVSKGFTSFIENDVIMAKITPCMENGKAAIARNLSNRIGFGSTEFHVLRANKGILPDYIFYFIRQKSFRKVAEANMTGSVGQKRVPSAFLKEVLIPLPPLNEQRRIVEKLEKILERVEACRERLEKIPLILKRFRQSVLAAACDGRLTADWRERNFVLPNVEEIIKALYQKRLSTAIKKEEKERIITTYQYKEENDCKDLPRGWSFIALNKLCSSFDYGTSDKSQHSGKIPVLRMGNIQNGKIDWNQLVYTSNEKEIQKYILKPKTVLFNRTNSPELVGKTAMYQGEQSAIFAGYLIRINNYPVLNSDYLNYCLNTNYAKKFCLRQKTDGVSQSNINAQKLGRFEVPFCSFSEQEEIVKRVEQLFKLADQIEARYQKAKAQVDKLTQSILAKAFRGELVPQDPNDEPASLLLERVQQEKSENTKPLSRNQVKSSKETKSLNRKASANKAFRSEEKKEPEHLQVEKSDPIDAQKYLPFMNED